MGHGTVGPLSIACAERQSPQRMWPWLSARWVSAIAKPLVTKIKIATLWALPVIAGAMAPVAVDTPLPVHVTTLHTLPIT